MIELDESHAIGWLGSFWDPVGDEFFNSADCQGVREQLYAQMMGWA